MENKTAEKIIIIGDLMLDIYHYCNTTRNASEADIPLYKIFNTKYLLGGASNVANNLNIIISNEKKQTEVIFISVIGDDEAGIRIRNLLQSMKIKSKLFIDSSRPTTQKSRIINENKIVGRYDIENNTEISDNLQKKILKYISKKSNIHSIIISDYAKGIITNNLCKKIIDYSNKNNIYTYIDPKPFDSSKYKNCFCFKPNLNEGIQISGKTEIQDIFHTLSKKINPKHIILTCDKNGMYMDDINNHIENNNDNIEPIDVTGCGDVVLSIIVYIYYRYKDLLKACKIANYIATYKAIRTIGNYQTTNEDIQEALEWENKELHKSITNSYSLSNKIKNNTTKIIYDYEINKIKKLSKLENIVFTNGCFDIVHSAHIKLLKYSKNLGEKLIVGLNSDSSIKQIKGEDRPINNEEERIDYLSSLEWIDYIILFNDTTPYNILKILQPNIMIKGGDYTIDKIIGSEFANQVIIYDYIEKYSTTNTINRVSLRLPNAPSLI